MALWRLSLTDAFFNPLIVLRCSKIAAPVPKVRIQAYMVFIVELYGPVNVTAKQDSVNKEAPRSKCQKRTYSAPTPPPALPPALLATFPHSCALQYASCSADQPTKGDAASWRCLQLPPEGPNPSRSKLAKFALLQLWLSCFPFMSSSERKDDI